MADDHYFFLHIFLCGKWHLIRVLCRERMFSKFWIFWSLYIRWKGNCRRFAKKFEWEQTIDLLSYLNLLAEGYYIEWSLYDREEDSTKSNDRQLNWWSMPSSDWNWTNLLYTVSIIACQVFFSVSKMLWECKNLKSSKILMSTVYIIKYFAKFCIL